MKKNNFFLIISITALVILCTTLFLVSCNDNVDTDDEHQHNYLKVEEDSTFKMVCECGDVAKGYRVQFIYAEDNSQADADIEVVWTDAVSGNSVSAKTNAMGYVENLQITNEQCLFSVNENTLPVINGVKYQFNFSAINTQQNGVGLTIALMPVHQPLNIGDETITGRLSTLADRYAIELNKTYFAIIKNASDEIWYDVQHNGFGKYTVDASSAVGANITLDKYNASFATCYPDYDVDASISQKLTYVVQYPYSDSYSTFRIKAQNATSYPVCVPFKVSITYTPDVEIVDELAFMVPEHFETVADNFEYTITEEGSGLVTEHFEKSLLPAPGVAKCADIEGSEIVDLTSEQMDNLELRADGYYYTLNNQLVYVKLDAPSIFMDLTLKSYASDASARRFHIYTIYEADAEYGYYTRQENYFGFIQAYSALANKDGLYPLTEEMLSYVTAVAKKEHQETRLLLCTYPSLVSDFTVGLGTESNPFVLDLSAQTLGNYNVSIASGSKVYVTLNGTMDIVLDFNSNIKATIDSIVYNEYYEVDGSSTLVLETKDGSALDFILEIREYKNLRLLTLGANNRTFESGYLSDMYFFTAPEAGDYEVSIATQADISVSASIQEDSGYTLIENTLSFTLTEGQILYFKAETDGTVEAVFEIIIEKIEN